MVLLLQLIMRSQCHLIFCPHVSRSQYRVRIYVQKKFHSHLLIYNHTWRTFLQCMSTELLSSPGGIVGSWCTVTSYRMYSRFQLPILNRKTSCFHWINNFHHSSLRCCRCCSSMCGNNLYISVFCSAAYNSVCHCSLKSNFRFVDIRWSFFPYEFVPSLLKINRFFLLYFVVLSFVFNRHESLSFIITALTDFNMMIVISAIFLPPFLLSCTFWSSIDHVLFSFVYHCHNSSNVWSVLCTLKT